MDLLMLLMSPMDGWLEAAGHFALNESSGCKVVAAIDGTRWQASAFRCGQMSIGGGGGGDCVHESENLCFMMIKLVACMIWKAPGSVSMEAGKEFVHLFGHCQPVFLSSNEFVSRTHGPQEVQSALPSRLWPSPGRPANHHGTICATSSPAPQSASATVAAEQRRRYDERMMQRASARLCSRLWIFGVQPAAPCSSHSKI
jgi:hypothetical protein